MSLGKDGYNISGYNICIFNYKKKTNWSESSLTTYENWVIFSWHNLFHAKHARKTFIFFLVF